MQVVGIAVACVGVMFGATAPFLLRNNWFKLGNLSSLAGGICNVAATQFAPQSEIQPLAGLMVPATVVLDAVLAKRRLPRTRKFWFACVCVVLGDAAIVACSPAQMRNVDPDDANVLWMILVGAALTSAILLGNCCEDHWAVHGLRPGVLSGFAITSLNAFLACVRSGNPHKHMGVFGIFAAGLLAVQVVLFNKGSRDAKAEVDFQSVYVSSVIVSGTLVGLATLEETPSAPQFARLALALAVVVASSYVVAREHAAHRKAESTHNPASPFTNV
jgi:hypothetical protein